MSVRAYRIQEIKTKKAPSFNLWHDTELGEFLEANSHFFKDLSEDGIGLAEISVKTLKEAIIETNMPADVRQALERDIKFAEAEKEEYIRYYCC